jgi:hypothetical protein
MCIYILKGKVKNNDVREKLKIDIDAWSKKQGQGYPKEIDKSFQIH